MIRIKFFGDNFYHIYNRGVDKRKIFLDKKDYHRFVYNLYEFNDDGKVTNQKRRLSCNELSYIRKKGKSREILVEILCYCLMPNHFHLVLKQLKPNGISKFMHKLGTGYTLYFNQKHKRSGRLFQNSFRGILIEDDKYFLHLSRYIHLNPIKLIFSKWEEKGVKSWKKANEFLQRYKWSSYLDYTDMPNTPFILKKDFLQGYFKDSMDYKKFVNEWMVDDIKEIDDLSLSVRG